MVSRSKNINIDSSDPASDNDDKKTSLLNRNKESLEMSINISEEDSELFISTRINKKIKKRYSSKEFFKLHPSEYYRITTNKLLEFFQREK